jgi:hypothetical protein
MVDYGSDWKIFSDQNLKGTIDEVGFWNRSLTSAEVAILYASGSGLAYPFVNVVQTFINQDPVDVTIGNIFSRKLNVTYEITGITNYSSIVMKYKTNSTNVSCAYNGNGTCLINTNVYSQQRNPAYNVTNTLFNFSFQDNEVYPAVYQYPNETYMEGQTKQTLSLNQASDISAFWLRNISLTSNINIFEIYLNKTSSPSPLLLYYCNSSYVTGNMNNANCGLFATLNNTQSYNHTHGLNSHHYTFNFPMAVGMIGTVKVSPDSQFVLLKSSNTGSWTVKYIQNVTRADEFRYSTNNGNAYTSVSGSPDMHLHQFSTQDKFCYYTTLVESGNTYNATERCDTLDFTPLAPSLVSFISPNTTHYNNTVVVEYTSATPSYNTTISSYFINLCNSDLTFNKSIATAYLNNTYNISLATVDDGNYTVCVDSYNNFDLSSRSYSQSFISDKASPGITFITPSPLNTTSIARNANLTTNINIVDDNLFAYECMVYDTNGILYANDSLTNINTTNYTVAMTFSPDMIGQWQIDCRASDGHTSKTIEAYPYTIDSGKNIKFMFEKIRKNKEFTTDNVSITFSGGDADISNTKLVKAQDRYNIQYTLSKRPVTPEIRMNYRVMCEDMYYLSQSAYTAHMVCYSSKTWIDFQSADVLKYQVKSCGDDCYDVQLVLKNNEDIEFSSIGGLNFNNASVTFDVYDLPPTNTSLSILGICPATIEGQMSLWIVFAMVAFFLLIALIWKIALIGFLDSIALLFFSFVIYDCFSMLGMMMSGISILMLAYFIFIAIVEWRH